MLAVVRVAVLLVIVGHRAVAGDDQGQGGPRFAPGVVEVVVGVTVHGQHEQLLAAPGATDGCGLLAPPAMKDCNPLGQKDLRNEP